MNNLDDLLTRGVANIIPNKQRLLEALNSKKLNIYIGIDPTSTHIHLGHAVPLKKLDALAKLGHNVTFLIGDFTALIGDTSDKESERPILTTEEIKNNFKTYQKQAEKVLDFSKINIKHNSTWLDKLSFSDIVSLSKNFSLNDFITRELIQKRLKAGKHVRLDETLYPIMQGYDSYYMDTDLQLGGTDQTFNMQAGRILQKKLRSKDSYVMTNEFLSGTDGNKMSKSLNNAIWLDDTAYDIYTKTMAISDDLIHEYLLLATDLPIQKINELNKDQKSGKNPMEIKKILAKQIVTELYSESDAQKVEEEFKSRVQGGKNPEVVDEVKIPKDKLNLSIQDLLIDLDLASSKSEAKRLIAQNGVSVNNTTLKPDDDIKLEDQMIIKVGKHRIKKIRI